MIAYSNSDNPIPTVFFISSNTSFIHVSQINLIYLGESAVEATPYLIGQPRILDSVESLEPQVIATKGRVHGL